MATSNEEMLVKEKKFVRLPFPDQRDTQHIKFKAVDIPVYHKDGTVNSDVSITFEYRRSRYGICNEKYTLFMERPERKKRIFQIEVYPNERVTHRDMDGVVRGSHVLYLNRTKNCVTVLNCGKLYRDKWFERFLRHTNIEVIDNRTVMEMFDKYFPGCND